MVLWQFHCDLHICLTCIGTAAYPDIHAMGVCRAFQEGARKRLLECHCISTQPCPSWTATYHCQSLHCSKSTPGSALFPGHDISVLCCAVLCCAVLCCAVLCCAVLCCAVLCCAVQRNAVQYGIPLSQGKVVCHTVLCCSVALCSMSRHSMLRCTLSSFGSVLLKSLLSFCTGSRPGSRSLVYFQDVAGGCTLLVTTEGGRQADGAAAEWSANPCFCHGHALGR